MPLPPITYIINVRRQSIDLRLRESLWSDFAHNIAESQQRFVVEFGRPSIGQGNQARGRNLTDEKTRRQVGRSPRTPELELRIRRFTGIPGRGAERGYSEFGE